MKEANLIIKLDEILKKDETTYKIDNNDDYIIVHKRTFSGLHEIPKISKLLKNKIWWISTSLDGLTELIICKK